MSEKSQILEKARALLNALSEELREIEQSIESGDPNAVAVIDARLAGLRQQWRDASARLDAVAADTTLRVDDIKFEAQRRWRALQAAVQTYRDLSNRRPPTD